MFESSAGCSEDSSLHKALRAVIPTISHFVHEEHDITARSTAVRLLAALATYPNLHDTLRTAIPHLVFVLKRDNDPDLKYETAVALECFMEYPSLQHHLVDDIPLIHAQLGRNLQDIQSPGEPQTHGDTDFLPGNATTTSITQPSSIRRRGPPSKEEDSYHLPPRVSLPSPRDARFTIPVGLRNFLKDIPSHLPFGGASPQPNPTGRRSNCGEWLTLPDFGRWFTKIGNYIGAAYLFVIAPPFVHDRTAMWDLERLGRRLGAFQTWVWAANAALFAASVALPGLTGVSSSPVAQSFVVLCGIFGLFGFVYTVFLAFRIGDCNAQCSTLFIDRANSVQGAHSFWNIGIMLSLPLTWMTWAVASLLCFMLSLGVQQAILDVRPSGSNDARVEIDSPAPKALSILQLSGFTVTIVWSLSYVFMIHREIRRCTDSLSSP